DGPTGNVRARFTDHASGTLQENPLVADVNNDGKAEIIIGANNYAFSGTTGVRIIRSQSNSWAPAPPVWNQHAYTISNIEDDIKIPLVPVKNWTKWNNFRAGAPQEGLAGAMPDLFVHDFEACVGGCVSNSPQISLNISLGNRGGLDVSSVNVELRRGSPTGPLVKSLIASGPNGGAKTNVSTSVTRTEWGAQALYAVVSSRDAKVECILENNATNLGFAPVVPDIDNDNIPDVCDACITRGAEACNGLDDDCDGQTDEGCDDDNDDYCDASMVCGVSPSCPLGCGDCNDGNGAVNPGAADSVCNGVDNDCDGQTDEHYQVVQTQCGVGSCRRSGATACVAGEVRDSCSPGAPATEVCDGADNDCDGLTDGVDTSLVLPLCEKQQGVCSGASKSPNMCVNGVWQACADAQYSGFAFPHYSTTDLCDNRDNDCDGLRDENHLVESTSCGSGACARTGQRICSNGNIVNTCSAGAPAASDASCNGVDDDCDGQTDEHYAGAQTSCGTGLCARTGQNYCVNGAVINSCVAGQPAGSDASCNGVDDDCDGATDEHFVATQTSCGVGECARTGTATCNNGNIVNSCTPGPAAAEVCDGKDNDCDGLVDGADANMALVACEKQQGVCSGLMKTASQCVGGAWQACSEPYYQVNRPSYSPTDTCDGLDNDCDGGADEDFTPAATTCGVGGCQRAGETSCVEGTLVDSCVAAAPRTETCDGVDNDCDGATDAADDTLSLVACEKQDGVCAGALKPATLCVAGGWLACGDGVYAANRPGYATVDGCDGLDNDCDGGVDEGFVSVATSCGVGECRSSGATSCVAGNVVDSCLAGQAQAEVCDGKDNDCDGLVDAVDPSLVSVACEKQSGVCAGVLKPANLCVGGVWQSCTDAVYVVARFGQYSLLDACDGVDNDCDVAVDEDFTATATSCGRGACERSGQRICSGGAVVDTCLAGNPAASDTTCNGVDDDCDGQTDESYVVRGTTCGQGACERSGFAYCVQGQLFDSCVAAATAANDRTCDGNDDDCDGQVDEDFLAGQICIAGLGACERTGTLGCSVNGTVCTAAQGVATPEVCDGVDNDCDGVVDEAVAGSVCPRKDTAISSGPPVVTA
ncbi:MAG TPA: putative metal-binding motif-containing protein, partial [Myxococcota bacterium]|nr:putative metal-binding motif-containing protein [Myxococcota bacterium]